jgi:hypothetical protein
MSVALYHSPPIPYIGGAFPLLEVPSHSLAQSPHSHQQRIKVEFIGYTDDITHLLGTSHLTLHRLPIRLAHQMNTFHKAERM